MREGKCSLCCVEFHPRLNQRGDTDVTRRRMGPGKLTSTMTKSSKKGRFERAAGGFDWILCAARCLFRIPHSLLLFLSFLVLIT